MPKRPKALNFRMARVENCTYCRARFSETKKRMNKLQLYLSKVVCGKSSVRVTFELRSAVNSGKYTCAHLF